MEVKLIEHTCPRHGCGMNFWTSDKYDDRRRDDHELFYCPNGHGMSYRGETNEQKLIRITRAKNAEIARLSAELATCQKKRRR